MLPENCAVTDNVHITGKYAAVQQGAKPLCSMYVPFSGISPS